MEDRLSQLRNLLDKDPNDAFCMYGIAIEYSKSNNFAQAIAWFDRTLEVDPQYVYAWYHKAKVQEQAGDTHSATETLRDGIVQAHECGENHAEEEMRTFLQSLL